MEQPNVLHAEVQLSLMRRVESYRVRLLPFGPAEREQELVKISEELAQEEQALQNCAYVVLEGFRPLKALVLTQSLLCCRRLGNKRHRGATKKPDACV